MYKLYNDFQLKFVENQYLYRNKDNFRFFKTKSSYIFIQKTLYLVINSVIYTL